VHDSLTNSWAFRTFNVLDDQSREGLGMRSISDRPESL
jgi:hypothetical protein